MAFLLSLILSALSLSVGTTYAYMEPQEVFTDLEIPDMPAQQQQAEATAPEPSVDVQAPTQAPPSFFRSGEQVELKAPMPIESDTKPAAPASPFDTLEEIPVIEEESEESDVYTDEDESVSGTTNNVDPAVDGTEIMEEEKPEEEVADKSAASSGFTMMKLVNRMKYPLAGILLAGLAFTYFFRKKKVSPAAAVAAAASAPEGEKPIPAPESPQNTETSSPRLEHALEAMQEEDTPANEAEENSPPAA